LVASNLLLAQRMRPAQEIRFLWQLEIWPILRSINRDDLTVPDRRLSATSHPGQSTRPCCETSRRPTSACYYERHPSALPRPPTYNRRYI